METERLSARLRDWITERATASDDGEALLDGLCNALCDAGVPLWRASVSGPTIDPAHRSVGLTWYAQEGMTLVFIPHEQDEAMWLRSPIFALLESGEHSVRYRLEALRNGEDFPILHELRDQGGTDYLLHLITFAPGIALRGVALSFATRAQGGFDQDSVSVIEGILPTLGLALARLSLAHTLREVLGTYVGPVTAGQVLEGNVRRGQGRTVSAAILLADLRGFTALSDRSDPLDMVTWLNEHFDALGDPVTGRGGEILKFLGDGFLAAFTVPDAGALPCNVCREALSAAVDALAANDALNARRRAAGRPELPADLVLHFGEVVYGNVGTGRRLDFTLIGRAVNEASRIEGQCQSLGHPLLISDAFAARCADALEEVGTVPLRGLARPQRLWTLPGLDRSVPVAATGQ
ncbi:adenylate/guanylate cyclase domain-containing protein [Methylobacterium sp. C25]|uniref:adenylate/guanylate cyclase domain-containing protein n=1 Tax=Methylobacterium sp. C25 TaxID=2721622 RepID=UPI001F44698E|nr:adenylate/guanylate cyclase domain-containing protein [Methylobacterium sp. C25]MCE4224258.1 adenylate/guanylate cyclase domain-containing protein [Methylobacterium sp. C25]